MIGSALAITGTLLYSLAEMQGKKASPADAKAKKH